jgi:uncharacterized membrane protein
MAALVALTLLMVAGHVVPSAPTVRARLIQRFGRGPFLAGHSILSLVALALVIWAFRAAEPEPWLVAPGPAHRWLAVALMPLAVLLVVGRLTTAAADDGPRGIDRITAVPGSLGVLLWCFLHLVNVAEARLVVVFVGMAAIALVSTIKNWRQASPAYRRSGLVPFASMAAGRQRLVWHEIGWWRMALAVAVYILLLLLHPLVIGADPLATL